MVKSAFFLMLPFVLVVHFRPQNAPLLACSMLGGLCVDVVIVQPCELCVVTVELEAWERGDTFHCNEPSDKLTKPAQVDLTY